MPEKIQPLGPLFDADDNAKLAEVRAQKALEDADPAFHAAFKKRGKALHDALRALRNRKKPVAQ